MDKTSGLVLEIGHNHCLVLTEDNNYVRIKLSGASPRVGEMFSGYPFESGFSLARRPVSRLWAYVASFLITLLVGGGGYVYAINSPAAYVSLDANSSVELVVNSLGKVIKANSFNAQGNSLLGKVDVGSLPVKDAVKSLVTASAQDANGEGQIVVITYTDASFIDEADLDKVALEALHEAHFSGDLLTQLIDRNYRSKAADAHLSGGQLLVLDLISGHAPLALEELKNKNLNQVLAEHKIKLNQLINNGQGTQKFHPNLIPVQTDTPAPHNSSDTKSNKDKTQQTTFQQTTLQQTEAGSTQKPAQNLSQAAVSNSVTMGDKVLSTETNPDLPVGNTVKAKEGVLPEPRTTKSPTGNPEKSPVSPQVNASDNDKSNGSNDTTQKAKDTNTEKEKPKNQDNKVKTDKNSKGNSQQNQLLTLLPKPLQWSGLFV